MNSLQPSSAIPRLDVDPFGSDFLSDPYAYHDLLRDAGPVFWLERYGVYGTARHEEVTAALRNHETFLSGRGVGLADFSKEEPWRPVSLLLEVDPPLHTRTRELMTRIVSVGALKEAEPRWQAEADALIEQLVALGKFDAVIDLAEVYPMRIFPDMIGLPREGREHLLTYAAATFNAFGPRNELFLASERAAAEATAWVQQACKRANLEPGGWGMEVYRAADEGKCSAEEAERLVRSFLTAGVDTTVNGIAHLMLAFASAPDQWARLRANPGAAQIKKAFEESLRWDSTAQTFFRTTGRDAELTGVPIPAGSKVLLFLGAANRDPRRFENPERFDIQRVSSGHVGFGFGIHQCLGQMVARQEAEMILNALIPRVENIIPAGKVVRRLNNTLHALASLPVEVVPVFRP